MSNSSTDKQTLTRKLAELLGFDDDGATDVLEHLLSIESQEDLLDYLSSLLGQEGDDVKSFVENVGKFQRGESLLSTNVGDDEASVVVAPPSNKQETTRRQENYMNATTTTTKRTNQSPPSRTNNKPSVAAKAAANKKKQAAATAVLPSVINSNNMQQPNNKQPNKQATNKQLTNNKTNCNNKQSSNTITNKPSSVKTPPPARKPPVKKSQPKKGTRSFPVCSCFGTTHKPLTNCLYCGRISCVKEGYDFCPSCSIAVERIEGGDEQVPAKDKAAWLHKERLLRFDRDFAQRTVVLDAQEDYYVNSSGTTWLSKDEQETAQAKQDARDKDMHQRKHPTLNIAF